MERIQKARTPSQIPWAASFHHFLCIHCAHMMLVGVIFVNDKRFGLETRQVGWRGSLWPCNLSIVGLRAESRTRNLSIWWQACWPWYRLSHLLWDRRFCLTQRVFLWLFAARTFWGVLMQSYIVLRPFKQGKSRTWTSSTFLQLLHTPSSKRSWFSPVI